LDVMSNLMASQKTFNAKTEDNPQNWVVYDLTDCVLGRAASHIAQRLRGKHSPQFTPHVDCGDHVVVINASKVKITGNKPKGNHFHWHTGFVGGINKISLDDLRRKHPDRLVENAVKGMLPKNSLGRTLLKKLHVYGGDSHPHQAQNPSEMQLNLNR